jgi:hypothetical protein
MPKRLWFNVKAAAVIGFGLALLHEPAKAAAVTPLDGPCITGCCFCVSENSVCGETGLAQDSWCEERGCGPFVECNEPSDNCNINETEVVCQPE